MEKKLALIGIIVEDSAVIDQLNSLLHAYDACIVGRMGIPYRDRGVRIISVVVDASADDISSLEDKLGTLHGVRAKTIYAKVNEALD